MMMELAIGLVLAGALVALLVPLIAMQRDQDADRKDVLAMQQARQALLGQAVAGGGLPAPVRFEESSIGTENASSHLTLDSLLAALPPGWAGALPGQSLGVPHVSSLQTAYWYDVQPALRADPNQAFAPLVEESSPDQWSFLSIIDQFDPDQNPRLSTGGHKSQLCRNLNSLQAIEQAIRADEGSNYQRAYLNVTLPRVWGAGMERYFTWNSALGHAEFSLPQGSTTPIDALFDNSAAAAFVVARRQAPALRRLDRQNAVYWQAGLSGLDKALSDRGDEAYPPAVLSGERGFRVYENPSTSTTDNPTADTADYAGLVQAVSLGEFAQSLRNAGLCNTPPEACKANQLFVRFSNSVRSAPPEGNAIGLTMRWSLVDATDETTYQSGDVAQGSATGGICLDAFATDTAGTAPARHLRIAFISPSGTVGYSSGNAWFRQGVLVDPNGSHLAADAGITRWRPLSALSAAEAGKTVSVSCTGTHTVSAALPAGELSTNGALPVCSVTQLP